MAKLPKLSDFTDVSGLMNKVKSAIGNLAGPSGSAACEEALAKEPDPTKAKLIEVELLISQLHELMVLQNKAVNDLATKYDEVKNLALAALGPTQEAATAEAATTEETAPQAKPSENKEKPRE